MNTLRLALRMVLRDLRAGELHLLGLAIVVAVAALTSVGFLGDRVSRALDREANQLLGGDLLLRADHPWSGEITAEARRRDLGVVGSILFTSMVSSESGAQLAAVKVVDSGYPLRGSVRIAKGPNQPDVVAGRVPERGEVWLDERLLSGLGVSVGERVGLGELEFRVGGMVTFESDRGANFFSLLPRAMFNAADLPASGLLVQGSRATWRLHLAGSPDAIAGFEAWTKGHLGRGEAIETIENARPEVRTALDQAQRFLRLAALLAVILAAVAVGLSARRFMRRHLDACAVMRCLGARQRQVMAIVLGEFVLFGLAAAVLGTLIGWAVHQGLVSLVLKSIVGELPAPSFQPLFYGLSIGLVLLTGFVFPQVLRLRHVPALRVLRREIVPIEARSAAAWLVGGAALVAVIFWVAGEFRLGAMVSGSFAVALGLFSAIAWGLLLLLGRMRGAGTLRGSGWRYGLAALVRRKGSTIVQVSAIGVGMTALVLLTLVRGDLLDSWRRMSPPDAPNRFVINIQPDQREPLARFFTERRMTAPAILPMIRGRLTAINGREVRPEDYAEDRTRRLAEREFNLSYGTSPPEGNSVVAGTWHGNDTAPQFSVEQGLAETFHLKVGDRVRFTVAGRAVEAPITSVRKLDWDSMRVNFFFIASVGMLENDPASLIISFRQPEADKGLTQDLVRRFPNFSVIDVDAVIGQLRALTDQLVLVVQFVFIFALVAGFIVLFAALESTHDEREFELAMLRTLGARNRQMRQAIIAEFSVLGVVATLMAVGGASAIGWGLGRQVFKIAYTPDPLGSMLVIAAGTVAVVLGGWIGMRKLFGRVPMAVLRNL
ncbi:MAG TPA: FtsX-like permease family protein [Aromatoleum sp.]|uniref:ABC transporter permease n=1 Tax=Aromatoleum sp. TaxID=2307007 RepID=UPI002B48C8C0|nr:FtsX-like permease family protein [Aromatoleum sp.]HJV26149.1 FtsX-like permease family protein [Aromatoleum sp.]